jgi:hypothetical protein
VKRAFFILPLVAAGCAIAPGAAPFPAREAAQLRLRDAQDVAAMRRHGWAVFAGVTQARPGSLPAFERWQPIQRAFGGGERRFRLVEEPESAGVPLRQASGAPLMSLVLFNPAAYSHIRSQQLFARASLERINAGFAAGAPLGERQIAPFPRDAMAMKLVWAVVHAQGLTPISVWDGEGEGGPARWPRTILVGPGAVPLDHFYHVAIGAADIETVRAIDPSAQVGDHAVLLAMHLTTKEIPDWIWATYWWHDRPDAGPFAADRPARLAGPWRHYLMDVAYSMAAPAEADGTPNAVFNPYLEVFAGGTRSNCMACHQGAVWTANGAPPFLPVTRGARRADDPRFIGATRLDFMWSIATEAR